MEYSNFVEVYDALDSTSKRLEKETIIAGFLKKLKGNSQWIYLLRGRVLPDYDPREFGISNQLVIKAIAVSFGVNNNDILKKYRKIGDLGEIAEEIAGKKIQGRLFFSKLTVKKVFDNLQKLMNIEGKGTVGKKMSLISELLGQGSGKEAKYIVRTLLGQLRVGVAGGILRDAIAEAFFARDKKEMSDKIEAAYDMANDFAVVYDAAASGKKDLDKIGITVGRAMNVMLAVKAKDIEDAFRICGKPAAVEHKYDGFRVVINKDGEKISLFTRRLEEVTKQFPDIVDAVRKNVKGKNFILDSEAVGYDSKTKKYKPFEAISQRIKRKYDIDKLVKSLPVELNIFDVLYLDGKSLMDEEFRTRRKILEKIIKNEDYKIKVAKQIVTSSEKEAMEFYKDALKIGEEGIMVKKIDAPYRQGRRVGYMVKLKPAVKDLDLVIVGAEYGSGKRGGLLTSYIVACRDEDKFLEVGKVSSGLKELEQNEGTTYDEMNNLLQPLILSEDGKNVTVKPRIVVSVTYQNIQKSPSYSSGFALRFPRITAYRADRSVRDIATLSEIKKEVGKHTGNSGMGSL